MRSQNCVDLLRGLFLFSFLFFLTPNHIPIHNNQMKSLKLHNEQWVGGKDAVDTSGSTVVVSLVTPSHVIVANLGDCRALLISSASSPLAATGAWTSLALSEMHKPDNPTERARIEAAGETVERGRVGGTLAVAVRFFFFFFFSSVVSFVVVRIRKSIYYHFPHTHTTPHYYPFFSQNKT